jgi:serine/threonine protein kinase/predicted Zn-dependent protease
MAETCAQCGKAISVRPSDGTCPHCKKPFGAPTTGTRGVDPNETEDIPRGAGKDGGDPKLDFSRLDEKELERLPRRVNNYELLEIIGRGGMGVVYRARHVLLERFVALKLVRHITPEHNEPLRFVAEAQVTGQIEHPNIVPVHEVGADEHGRPYFVMKLVRGRSLGQILVALEKRDPATVRDFPLRRLLNIFCDVCQAVAFAHSKGVLHRDLKPGNVMIGDFGEVLLMDWGLAKKISAPDTPALSPNRSRKRDGAMETIPAPAPDSEVHTVRDHRHETSARFVAGTPEYMSPEQALGESAALKPRSDVYSLGAVLFELLTYRPPHLDPDTTRLIARITTEPVRFPPPSPHRSRVPKALRAIALKALALNPEHRYPSAVELLQDVRAYLEDRPVSACPDTLFDQTARLFRRHGPIISTIAAALLVLSVGASVALWQLGESERRRRTEELRTIAQRKERLKEQEKRLRAEQQAEKEKQDRARAEARAAEERRTTEDTKRRELEDLARAMPLYLDGLEMLQRRQYDAAIRKLEAAIEIGPLSPLARPAHFACGEAYERKGTQAGARAAIAHFQSANRLARRHGGGQARDPRALLRCGEISWRMLSDAESARDYYNQAATGDPQDPYARLARAYVLILNARKEKDSAARKEKARSALELALQIVASGNPLWEAHYVAADLYAGQELPGALQPDPARALQHYTLALDLEPSQPDSLLGRARVARQLGDKSLALVDYTSVLRVRPDFRPAVSGRVELLLETGRASDALKTLDEVLAKTPDDVTLRVLRVRTLADLGRWPDVRKAADGALHLKPNDPALLFLRARAHLEEKRFLEAAADLDNVLKAEPANLNALQLRAAAYLRIGKTTESEADYRRLLEQAPARSELWRGLGDALHAQKRTKEALEAYANYLRQQPNDVPMRLHVARLLYEQPGAAWFAPDKAIQQAREADRSKPDGDPHVWIVLSEALMAAGQRKEALQQIERAYTRFPTSNEVQKVREKLRSLKPPEK